MSNRQARREQMKTNRQQRAAQRPAPQRPSGSPRRTGGGGGPLQSLLTNPFYLVVGLVVIAGIAGLIALVMLREDADAGVVGDLEAAHANFPSELADGVALGDADAPIELTMYEDFQCPFCLRFTATQEPEIIEEFVKAGKVRLVYKHLPILGRESLQAARGAQCAAEQDRFWEYKHEIFLLQAKEGQLSNERLDSGRLSDGQLGEFAAKVGIDRNEWQRCMEDEASLAAVQADEAEARAFGIRGTPGFSINGQALGGGAPSTMDGWRQIFDSFLNATPTATTTGTAATTGTATAAATATPTP